MGRRVRASAEPDGIVTIPHEGQGELLVGDTLVSRVREELEPLEERNELQVLVVLPDRLEDGDGRQRAVRRHPDLAGARPGDHATLDEQAILLREPVPLDGGDGGDKENEGEERTAGSAGPAPGQYDP